MSLTFHVARETDGILVRRVFCRPHSIEPSGIESNPHWTLTLPLRGLFRKHVGPNHSGIADPTRALFFLPGRAYRVSHFDTRGDECLSFDYCEPALEGFVGETDAVRKRNQEPISVPLSGAAQRLRGVLAAALTPGLAGGSGSGAGSALEIEERAIRLLEFSFAAIEALPRASVDRSGLRRRRTDAVVERFHADPGHDWNLDQLARAAYSSRRQLTASFRAETGLSIHRYLLQLRLSRALDEILAGEREISEIGLDLGFSTPSHFAAGFRQVFGISPSTLRREQLRPFSTALLPPRR